MTPTRRHRTIAFATGALLALSLTGAACSGDDDDTEAAYCDAWSAVVSAFDDVRNVDLIGQGVDGVKASLDALRTSIDELGTAGRDQLGDEAAAFSASARELADTLTDPDLPVDRRAEVRAARAEVDAAWNTLVDAAKADCASIPADKA